MAGESTLLWRLLPAVRRPERTRFAFFFGLSALLSLAQTLGLAGSEALYLSQVGIASLPFTFVLASLATVASCILYATLVGHLRNDVFYIALLGSAAVGLMGSTLLLQLAVPGVLHGLFCAAYLTQAILINLHFWTFASDYFDTLQSKRLFPYLVVGASAGGVVGGLIAAALSFHGSAELLIPAWAATLLVAAYTVFSQRLNLRGWHSVGVEEADEASVEGIRGALRFVKRSAMARWLVLSVVGMVLSLFIIQYVYMGIFQRSFPSAETLATFLGVYLAASNALEILVGTIVTPWSLRRFGVATANLLHPIMTLGIFVLLALDPLLHAAILARGNRELLENALASPVRQLSYNALPFRFRGRMRALLEGVVLFGAMALAGALLMLIGREVSIPALCALGACAALLYAGASLQVRREYLRSLVSELRRGRLDLADLNVGVGQADLQRLAAGWVRLLDEDRSYPSPAVLQLAKPLTESGFVDVVEHATGHPQPRVRIVCIEALAEAAPENLARLLPKLLKDPENRVRLSAAKAVAALASPTPKLLAVLEECLDDPDPALRAEAAVHLGEPGLATLRSLLSGQHTRGIVAALRALPAELAELAHARLEDPLPAVRAAALDCIARLADTNPLSLDVLLGALDDPDTLVRQAAASALSRWSGPEVLRSLKKTLEDDSRAVREAAADGLAALGDAGALAAAPSLASTRVGTVDSALHAVSRSDSSASAAILSTAYQQRVADAWGYRASERLLATDPSQATRFLQLAIENAYGRSIWLAFRILSFVEDRTVVRSVRNALRSGSHRGRADALEVLSNLGHRKASENFALLMEAGPFDEVQHAGADFMSPPRSLEQVLERAEASDDRWLRLAAAAYRHARDDRSPSQEPPASSTGPQPEDEVLIMERLLALRNVPIFAHLTLDRLEAIHQLMGDAQYLRGEAVVREGEPGDQLFVLLEGEVQAFKGYHSPEQRLLSTLTPVGYFGEIAILDNAPRSATVIASEDSLLLTLGGAALKELVLQSPEISFEIFSVLTARIRAAETRR